MRVNLLRALRPGRNPLVRPSDRIEAALLLVAIAVGVALVPVMLAAGSASHRDLAERAAEQTRSWHETTAVLIEDAPGTAGPVGTREVDARWELRNGVVRTGLVEAAGGLAAGARISVWIDESGWATEAPLSTVDSVVAGVFVAVFGLLTGVGLLAFACCGVHAAFDRGRDRALAAEWAEVEPAWRGRRRSTG